MTVYEQALLDLILLLAAYKDDPEFREIESSRVEVLTNYQPIFSQKSISRLTAEDMAGFLRIENNHHWELHRRSDLVEKKIAVVRHGLSGALYGSGSLAKRLTRALNTLQGTGVGKGILTAVLHVVNPDSCGVWNNKMEKAMHDMGVFPGLPWGTTWGEKYVLVNKALCRLAVDMGLCLWDLDILWHIHATRGGVPPEVVHLGQVAKSDIDGYEAEEREVSEGDLLQNLTNTYERDSALRAATIRLHGKKCEVCGFDFEEHYGERGKDYIEVHHLTLVSKMGGRTKVSPKADMAVVCANCHRMIHRKKDAILSIQDMKGLLIT